ncbi:MAG: ABC transporter permease, partial [Bacillales bacterium]|nr:ABC transporter permease [Bacillales bacterium]
KIKGFVRNKDVVKGKWFQLNIGLYFSPLLLPDILENFKVKPEYLSFSIGNNVRSNYNLFQRISNNSAKIDVSINSLYSNTASIFETLSILSTALTGIAIFFGIFGFLITLNFIASSIKARKKEIGVLRATGARNSDLFNLFSTEVILIGIPIVILAGLGVYGTFSLVNNAFMAGNFGSSEIQLLSFDLITILIIVFFTYLYLFISTILPIISVLRKNPVDSIRRTE